MAQLMKRRRASQGSADAGESPSVPSTALEPIAIPPGDPLEAVLLSSGAPVEIPSLQLESPTVAELKAAGVELVVPLIGQGELLGALFLGRRLSDQPYSTDDRRLLGNLASQVAPAMKVAQLIREQQSEAEERERIQQELRVAALIQQTLLPKELPAIPGWAVDAFYRPAREVGGDFYDFIDLEGGRLGVIIGDVTDKGVPAALVMATSRSMLRAAASQHESPGAVLAEVNDTLVREIPPAMFVTCLYAIFDTEAGEVVFANAGHNLPYVRTGTGVIELRATGMPLGLMPGMSYDEKTYRMDDEEMMVLTSDGITEAHDPNGEMYGFGRLTACIEEPVLDDDMVTALVANLEQWSGPDRDQEDDITLVVLRRTSSAASSAQVFGDEVLARFEVSSVEGNERMAIERVTEVIEGLGLDQTQIERLKTAVGETVMNAIEHGNQYDPILPVDVEIVASASRLVVRVTDQGGDKEIPEAVTPDLEAKLAGEQTPRGWGLFLVGRMVDQVNSWQADGKHVVELVVDRKGAS